MMHVDAVPAEDVSAMGHLRCPELFFKADGAGEFFAGVIDDLLDLFPLVLLDGFEIGKSVEFVMRERVSIKDEGESAHKAFLAILHAIS